MNLAASSPAQPRTALLAFAAFLLTAVFSTASEPILLTNSNGKSIKAEILKIDAPKNQIEYRRLRDGRVFTSNLEIFDPATREQLQSFIAQKPQKTLRLSAKTSLKKDDVSRLQRAVIEMENRSSEEFTDLEIDIVVIFQSGAESETPRTENQTFPIRRIKGAGKIEVQTRQFAVEDSAIKGVAFRLREMGSENTVFSWKSAKVADEVVKWPSFEREMIALTSAPR